MSPPLVSARTNILDETTEIHEYIRRVATTGHVISYCIRQQKPEKEEGARRGVIIEGQAPVWYVPPTERSSETIQRKAAGTWC